HSMAATSVTGHGHKEIPAPRPATVDPSRFAYAGLHDGEPDALANVAAWGLKSFGPEDLRESSTPLLEWLATTDARKIAIHLDVDTVDSEEVVLGLGKVPGGLSRAPMQLHLGTPVSSTDRVD